MAKLAHKCPECGRITYFNWYGQLDGAVSKIITLDKTECGHIIRFELGEKDEDR